MFSQTFSSVQSVITFKKHTAQFHYIYKGKESAAEEDVDDSERDFVLVNSQPPHSAELQTETNAKPKLTFFYTRSETFGNLHPYEILSPLILSHMMTVHMHQRQKTPNDQLLSIEAMVSGGEGPELQSHCGTTGSPSGRVSPVSRGLPRDWGEEWMLHRCVVVKTELTLKLFSCRSTPQVYSHLWFWPMWSESWIQTTDMSFLCPVSVSSLETGWRSRWGGSGRSRTPSGHLVCEAEPAHTDSPSLSCLVVYCWGKTDSDWFDHINKTHVYLKWL